MRILLLVSAVVVAPLLSVSADENPGEAKFPSKEVTVIANYKAGGAIGQTALSVKQALPDVLDQSVVLEHVDGAGGARGIKAFLQEPADGYTILTSFVPATTFVAANSPELFRPDDLAIINVQWTDPAALIGHKKHGWLNAAEMLAAIKAEPGKYTFGSSGASSVGHVLSMDLFEKLGLEVRVIPYKGGGATRAAFKGGEVDLTAAGIEGALGVKEVSGPVGLFWEESVDVWPEAEPLTDVISDVDVEIGGAYRFHAVHADVKEEHPERFAALVEAFRSMTESKPFEETTEKLGVGNDWVGPDRSEEIIQDANKRFEELFEE